MEPLTCGACADSWAPDMHLLTARELVVGHAHGHWLCGYVSGRAAGGESLQGSAGRRLPGVTRLTEARGSTRACASLDSEEHWGTTSRQGLFSVAHPTHGQATPPTLTPPATSPYPLFTLENQNFGETLTGVGKFSKAPLGKIVIAFHFWPNNWRRGGFRRK